MANRSCLYLKNDQSTRVLCEGIVQIPLFWQCLWGEKELVEAVKKWKLAYALSKQDKEEELDALWESDGVDIVISLDDYRRYAQTNRFFVEHVFPDQLALYDQFLAYIEANVAEGDVLGADVFEIVEMGDVEEAEKELFGNQQAISQQDKSLIGVNSLFGESVYADFTGHTNYYADLLSETNRLITDDQLLEDQLKPLEQVESSQKDILGEAKVMSSAIDEAASADKSSWKWFGLIIGLVAVLLRYILTLR